MGASYWKQVSIFSEEKSTQARPHRFSPAVFLNLSYRTYGNPCGHGAEARFIDLERFYTARIFKAHKHAVFFVFALREKFCHLGPLDSYFSSEGTQYLPRFLRRKIGIVNHPFRFGACRNRLAGILEINGVSGTDIAPWLPFREIPSRFHLLLAREDLFKKSP